jgi:hypothetical protein
MITKDYIIEIDLKDHLRFIIAMKDKNPDEKLMCLYARDDMLFYKINISREDLIMLRLRFPIKIFDDNV